MASSAADRFVAGGGGAGEEQLLLLHHPQMYYHVPQHSRREKLRFPPEDQPPPAAPLLLLHEPSAGQTLYPAHSLTALLPSINSSSSSASPLYGHNPAALGYGATQFDSTLPIPPQQLQQQIHSQGVSLSLSSSPSPRPPPPPPRHHMATRPAPLGPFTGYAAVLNRSRFLEPARKLLEEVCHVGNQAAGASGRASQEMLLDADPVADSLAEHGGDGLKEDHPISGLEQQQWKKSRLLSMLDEVYKRYKQYYQQVQAVITSFESVAGLNGAAPYVSVALKALSKHFRHLKNIISDQLLRTNKGLGNEGIGREEMSSFGLLENSGYLHRTSSSGGGGAFAQPHVWRPQRGLPERAVSVLRSWLFEHFLHPYPTDVDKQNLAKQTGLTRNQVSNWFINARVRLWKPMVEEIHSLEMRQKNKITSAAGESHRGSDEQSPQAQPPPSSSNENPLEPQHLQHIVSNQFLLSRAAHGELTVPMPNHNIAEPVNLVSGHQHGGGAVSNGVSLTLGLPQNNAAAGVCFPLNVARRFGLEECNDAYLASAFGEQERQFGKDVGSRLLHDFVG